MNAFITRCKKAFAANNIPWDPALEKLPKDTLDHVSDCWERRAADMPVDEGHMDDQAAIREAQKIARNARNSIRGGARRKGQILQEKALSRYHGGTYGS